MDRFSPLKVHLADAKASEKYGWPPETPETLVIDEWLLLEYAVCFLPMNQDALAVYRIFPRRVGGVHSGLVDVLHRQVSFAREVVHGFRLAAFRTQSNPKNAIDPKYSNTPIDRTASRVFTLETPPQRSAKMIGVSPTRQPAARQR